MKKKNLTTKDIENWLNPWPIRKLGKERKWNFSVMALKDVIKFKNPNKLHSLKIYGDERISFKQIAKAMKDGIPLPNIETRYIELLARTWVKSAENLTIVAVKGKEDTVIFDGSSRLTALAYALETGQTPRITHVGVVMPIK